MDCVYRQIVIFYGVAVKQTVSYPFQLLKYTYMLFSIAVPRNSATTEK